MKYFENARSLGYNITEVESGERENRAEKIVNETRAGYLTEISRSDTSMIKAERYTRIFGMDTEETDDEGGGLNLCCLEVGSWADYNVSVKSAGSYIITLRVASLEGGGELEIFSESEKIATCSIPVTHGWQSWQNITVTAKLSEGVQKIRLYARKRGYNINWLTITGALD
jgi:hypothetical protein